MADWTLSDVSEKMREIDFAMLYTRTADGGLAGRPMSNNGDVEYEGDTFYFACEPAQSITDIEGDPNVALAYAGAKGFMGKPPMYISIAGRAELIRDKAAFEQHWVKDLERWFKQGTDTPGLVLIKVHASRVHYWDGEDQGEIVVG